ncbi:MAG: alanine racemase [Sphingomonadales bacterium]|jgi:alanine racemase
MSDENTILTVDLNALRANYRLLADRASPARCAAAVKANAYGLGVEAVVPALTIEGCDCFFVATFEEGVQVKPLAPAAEIYILEGPKSTDLTTFITEGFIPVINTVASLRAIIDNPLPFALHIDTGMNRLGVPVAEIEQLLTDEPDFLDTLPLKLVMSHLAAGGDPENEMNARQLKEFNRIRALLPSVPASLANSGGVLLGASYHHHMVRSGIGLYGGAPGDDFKDVFEAVVRLEARVIQIKTIKAGESVGYDGAWVAKVDSIIATLTIGYADGYSTSFFNNGKVLIGGEVAPVVGKISMDLTTVDITHLGSDKVEVGDYATLIGDELSLDTVAKSGNMHAYQLLTSLGTRVVRKYKLEE